MVTARDDIINVLRPLIEQFKVIDLCILYGSGAANRLTSGSDIDIAVASSRELTADACLDFSLAAGRLLEREVSVIDMRKMHGLILREVLVKGITLKNNIPLLKAEYIIKMQDYMQDLLPLQLEGLKRKAERFAHG